MIKYFLAALFILFVFIACRSNQKNDQPQKFDKVKWSVKKGLDYPHRTSLLQDLIDNYKLHGLNKNEVVNLLGEPDRVENNHLYYNVSRKYLGDYVITGSKTLVIKLNKDGKVEWRKIHG